MAEMPKCSVEFPYQAEYAKTARASCKGCKGKIPQGTLRVAVMVQSAFHDGKQPNWHHEECFFKKQRPTSVLDIANFNKLKTEDQKSIKEKIESNSGTSKPESKGKGKCAKKRPIDEGSANNTTLKDFQIEYAKSSRATCRHCEIKICKDEVRVCKVVFDTEAGKKYGGQSLWHHIKCFNDERHKLLYFAGGEDLPGFNTLKKEDQKMVKDEIRPMKIDEVPVKISKAEPKDEAELKEEKEKETKMEEQNILFHRYRAALSELTNRETEDLLLANSQEKPSGRDASLDHLADCMAFGALERCLECQKGQLLLDTFGYKCTGNMSEWTKCTYITQNPKRSPMVIPDDYTKKRVFENYKPITDVRIFHAAPAPTTLIVKNDEPGPSESKIVPTPPLKNLQFYLYGRLNDKKCIKKRILKLGGLVVTKLTDTTIAVISTKKDLDRMPDKMKEAKEKDIEVVEESFLDLIDSEKGTISESLEIVKVNNIADWGSDPSTRVPRDVIDGKSIAKSGSNYASTKSSSVKIKIKGGIEVDPKSKLQDEAHVLKDWRDTYTAVLCTTDVVTQKNSFYKLQVLQSDDKKKYWLFRSWGRIGTNIGGSITEPCSSEDEAKHKFIKYYYDKTKNNWSNRDSFEKKPGHYYPLEIDYGESTEEPEIKLDVDERCPLALPVQKLVQFIFDIDCMKRTLLEFELDTEKMPLGKLSTKQIKSGYEVLTELLKYIEKGEANKSKIIDATNRFFTLVPHDFGMNNAPLLDNVELIKSKTELLDNLLEIEIAYSLLKTDNDDESVSPIESHYKKLKAEIAPLHKDSEEFKLIHAYTKNTHGATHSSYALEIEQVFKVVREGEGERYDPFRKLHNRRLLWHGSRSTNFAGILSQGLRIAPPEAPVSGYMFGKGIYFADMVSKSASYCCTNRINPTGLMLLCEVALGNMKECYQAEDVKLPADKHSAWGVGRTEPDPRHSATLPDGTVVPLGTPIQKQIDKAPLLYNEFIVYDVAQVNVKYLLQMKFNHNY